MKTWMTVADNGVKLSFAGGDAVSHRIVFVERGRDIAYVVPTADDNGNGNARLIAAAPDLLEACKAMISTMPTKPVGDKVEAATQEMRVQQARQAVQLMRLAVAKAEGT